MRYLFFHLWNEIYFDLKVTFFFFFDTSGSVERWWRNIKSSLDRASRELISFSVTALHDVNKNAGDVRFLITWFFSILKSVDATVSN